MSKHITVAVDGPAGAGKSSVSREVASRLGFIYVDTGAMYRAVALKCLMNRLVKKDEIIGILSSTSVEIKYTEGEQHIYLDGCDVNGEIRSAAVSKTASDVSAIPEVRAKLLDLQRNIAADSSVIMDGRDIGTFVLPGADVKIFLTASSDERAQRRCREYEEKNIPCNYDEIKSEIEYRDYQDAHRVVSPLKQADDAILVNTDGIGFNAVVDTLEKIIRERL